ncbi:MAG: hypothetical protein IPF94_15700 [Betaproteobacteria bacterium]|nr:hypothetical protein [Betaproteobacteria bacterium]
MMSASQVTPRWQAEFSQSEFPRCTSSTNWYSSRGRRRWKTSRSSDELMVTVHTVFGAAPASADAAAAKHAMTAIQLRNRDPGQHFRRIIPTVFHTRRRRGKWL